MVMRKILRALLFVFVCIIGFFMIFYSLLAAIPVAPIGIIGILAFLLYDKTELKK